MRRAARLLLVSFLAPALLALVLAGTSSATGHCRTSGPSSAPWTVTVCITAPAEGATLRGAETVTATATTSDGRKVKWMQFFLDGSYVLTDYQRPYTFALPTDRWVDAGLRTLEAQAVVKTGTGSWTSLRADVGVEFDNGVSTPPPRPQTFAPHEHDPKGLDPLVVAAVGDGVDGRTTADDVADLIESWDPDMLLYLGDVYGRGTYTEFENWLSPERYGRFAPITNPAPGNHEYETPGADGYFDFWGDPPHYYSFDAGGWHFISLDSTAQFDQESDGTAQYDWLEQDLASSGAECTLAYWHHSVFTLASEGGTARMKPIWSLLSSGGTEVVLGGHDHNYVRWEPLDATGAPDPQGTTEFVVGTGGHYPYRLERSDTRVAKAVDSEYGALRLDLTPTGGTFSWIDSKGVARDSGTIECATGPDTTPPTAPGAFDAWAVGSSRVDMSWDASTDDRGVAGYQIYRDGSQIGAVGTGTLSYSDTGLEPATSYTYEVEAFDAADNLSDRASDSVTTGGAVFSDGFESGDMSKWTSVVSMTVGTSPVFGGTYAARATGVGTAAYASKTLSTERAELYASIRFKIVSKGANSVNLLRFRQSDGTGLFQVFVDRAGMLSTKNEIGLMSKISSKSVTTGTWHRLQLHVQVNGASSQTEVWLNGTRIAFLSGTANLGTMPVGRVQVGEHATGRTFDVAFDDVVADTGPV